MVTLRQIAQEALRAENEGYAIRYARQASNTLLQPKIFERLSEDDRSMIELMIVSYEVDVEGENPSKFITLPEFYMNLPFNKGLHAIAPIEDPTAHMIPRHTPGISRNLPCADLDPGQISYWTKGLKVYFDGTELDLGKVLVDLVVASPDSIGADDPLPIYAEMQYPLVMMVRQMLTNRPVQDRILDNNPDAGIRTQP